MLRRTFLALIGSMAWPWRKREVNNGFVIAGGQITSIRRLSSHGFYAYVRNVSDRRIEAGTCVKLVGTVPLTPHTLPHPSSAQSFGA